MAQEFDAIVVGSGISGGWAAKELCEKGLKVAMIERGRKVEHQADYKTEVLAPWEMPFRGFGDQETINREQAVQKGMFFDEWNKDFWVNDLENPYETSGSKPFQWRRGYQTGGRSLTWGRHAFRRGEQDFEANLKDGYGVDWPIRYKDIEPWYKYVEEFIGVSGDSNDNVPGLPNSVFDTPFELTAPEKALKAKLAEHYGDRRHLIIGRVAHTRKEREGRAPCQARVICNRGCSFGAYFSTQSTTLPAAMKTGNLTVLNDMIVEKVEYDAKTKRATGVVLFNTKDRTRQTVTAKLIFLNASTLNTIGILLRSASDDAPGGLGNSSGTLGKYIMDHASAPFIARVTGFDDRAYAINRPASLIVPRFANLTEPLEGAVRGYSYQGGVVRQGYPRGAEMAGLGKELKAELRGNGGWLMIMGAFIEALPVETNAVTLAKSATDGFGMRQLHVHYEWTENEKKLAEAAVKEATAMTALMGWKPHFASTELAVPGNSIHEMGGARMGRDPRTSVLNGFNQMHDVPNIFVTDGAAMSSSGTVNPSLTYMALTARACDHAVSLLKGSAL